MISASMAESTLVFHPVGMTVQDSEDTVASIQPIVIREVCPSIGGHVPIQMPTRTTLAVVAVI